VQVCLGAFFYNWGCIFFLQLGVQLGVHTIGVHFWGAAAASNCFLGSKLFSQISLKKTMGHALLYFPIFLQLSFGVKYVFAVNQSGSVNFAIMNHKRKC